MSKELPRNVTLTATGLCCHAGDFDIAAAGAALNRLSAVRAHPRVMATDSTGVGDESVLYAPISDASGVGGVAWHEVGDTGATEAESAAWQLSSETGQRLADMAAIALRRVLAELSKLQRKLQQEDLVVVHLPDERTLRGRAVDLDTLQYTLRQACPALRHCELRIARGGSSHERLSELMAALRDGHRDFAIFAAADSLIGDETLVEHVVDGSIATISAREAFVPGEAAACLALSVRDPMDSTPIESVELCDLVSAPRVDRSSAAALVSVVRSALLAGDLSPRDFSQIWINGPMGKAVALELFAMQRTLWPVAIDERTRHAQELGLVKGVAADSDAPPIQAMAATFGNIGFAALPLGIALAAASLRFRATMRRHGFEPWTSEMFVDAGEDSIRSAILLRYVDRHLVAGSHRKGAS